MLKTLSHVPKHRCDHSTVVCAAQLVEHGASTPGLIPAREKSMKMYALTTVSRSGKLRVSAK